MFKFIEKNLKYIAVIEFMIILFLVFLYFHHKGTARNKSIIAKETTAKDRELRFLTYPPGASIVCDVGRKIIKSESPFEFKLNSKSIKINVHKEGFRDTTLVYDLLPDKINRYEVALIADRAIMEKKINNVTNVNDLLYLYYLYGNQVQIKHQSHFDSLLIHFLQPVMKRFSATENYANGFKQFIDQHYPDFSNFEQLFIKIDLIEDFFLGAIVLPDNYYSYFLFQKLENTFDCFYSRQNLYFGKIEFAKENENFFIVEKEIKPFDTDCHCYYYDSEILYSLHADKIYLKKMMCKSRKNDYSFVLFQR